MMKVNPTDPRGCLAIEPRVFGEERGCFYEGGNRPPYVAAGIDVASQ